METVDPTSVEDHESAPAQADGNETSIHSVPFYRRHPHWTIAITAVWLVVLGLAITVTTAAAHNVLGEGIYFRPWIINSTVLILDISALIGLILLFGAAVKLFRVVRRRFGSTWANISVVFSSLVYVVAVLATGVFGLGSLFALDDSYAYTHQGTRYYLEHIWLEPGSDVYASRDAFTMYRVGSFNRGSCQLQALSTDAYIELRRYLGKTNTLDSDPNQLADICTKTDKNGVAILPKPKSEGKPDPVYDCADPKVKCFRSIWSGNQVAEPSVDRFIAALDPEDIMPIPGTDKYALATLDAALAGKRWIVLAEKQGADWKFVSQVPTADGVSSSQMNGDGVIVLETGNGRYSYSPQTDHWSHIQHQN